MSAFSGLLSQLSLLLPFPASVILSTSLISYHLLSHSRCEFLSFLTLRGKWKSMPVSRMPRLTGTPPLLFKTLWWGLCSSRLLKLLGNHQYMVLPHLIISSRISVSNPSHTSAQLTLCSLGSPDPTLPCFVSSTGNYARSLFLETLLFGLLPSRSPPISCFQRSPESR